MQTAQSLRLRDQCTLQVSALICHFKTPSMFEMLRGFAERSPYCSDWEGHFSEHISQASQNSVTPKSMGESGTNGKSVITLLILTLGPYFGVINNPFLPKSPSPACMAMGAEIATLLVVQLMTL